MTADDDADVRITVEAPSVDAVAAALDLERAQIEKLPTWPWRPEALRGLVHVFYDETFSVAGFLRDNPQFRGDVVNLLVGNVFRTSVGGLFEADHPIIIEPTGTTRWEHAMEAFNAAVRARYTNVTFAPPA